MDPNSPPPQPSTPIQTKPSPRKHRLLLVLAGVVLLILIAGASFFLGRQSVKVINQNEDVFCGGFAGKLCPSGYECQYEGNYPDAAGKCIKN